MKAETWDELWRDDKNRKAWSEPEEGLLDLIPTLKGERVLRTLGLGCGASRHVIVLTAEGLET